MRRRFLDDLAKPNQKNAENFGDSEMHLRVSQYELGYWVVGARVDGFLEEPETILKRYPVGRKHSHGDERR
ncbi:MAG: hypothetical protein L0312_21420 [Acidobacteria bacterium]|nr:hypothetical protein [Acidobacteriota bacterium]